MDAMELSIGPAIKPQHRLDYTRRGWFSRPTRIFVPIVEVNEFLVAHKEIPDVHISISSLR